MINISEKIKKKYIALVEKDYAVFDHYRKNCNKKDAIIRDEIKGKYMDPDNVLQVDCNGFSLYGDGYCGWKCLFDLYDDWDWIDDWKIIRQESMLWPRQGKESSINCGSYQCFLDRKDFTLFDIKRFYDCKYDDNLIFGTVHIKNHLLYYDPAKKKYTYKIGYEFLKSFNDFETFIKTFGYEKFVRKGDVVNITTNGIINSYDEFVPIDKTYIFNLIKIIKNEKPSIKIY